MHGEAYAQSARVASGDGPVRRLREERRADAAGDRQAPQARAHDRLDPGAEAARCRPRSTSGTRPTRLGAQHGYRNSQVTVLAPTGTIGFMMDCDTTGIEPDIALVKYKKLVGGGMMKIVNQSVPPALRKLGYTPIQVEDILHYIDEKEMIEGAPHLKDEHLAGLRLRLPAGERAALHPLDGPHQDDGGGAAVPLGRHLQDRQHADRRHARGHRAGLRRGAGSWASRRSRSTATAASAASR